MPLMVWILWVYGSQLVRHKMDAQLKQCLSGNMRGGLTRKLSRFLTWLPSENNLKFRPIHSRVSLSLSITQTQTDKHTWAHVLLQPLILWTIMGWRSSPLSFVFFVCLFCFSWSSLIRHIMCSTEINQTVERCPWPHPQAWNDECSIYGSCPWKSCCFVMIESLNLHRRQSAKCKPTESFHQTSKRKKQDSWTLIQKDSKDKIY